MTQEEKQLLIKDLCARLPYEVKVKTEGDDDSYALLSLHPNKDKAIIGLDMGGVYATSKVYIDNIIPYLRPMSSMSNEEKVYFETNFHIAFSDYEELYTYAPQIIEKYKMGVDWLNANHFDYRGLIPLGLAIKVTEVNNQYKD